MSTPTVSPNTVPQRNDAASANDASRSAPRKQSAWASSILTIVLITVILAAAVAIVAVTFLYWAPQARSWSFPSTDFFFPDEKAPGGLPAPSGPARPEPPPPRPSDEIPPEGPFPPHDVPPAPPRPFSPVFDEDSFREFFLQPIRFEDSPETPADDGIGDDTPAEIDELQGVPRTPPDSPPSEPPGTPFFPPDGTLFESSTPSRPGNPADDSRTDREMTAQETPPETYVQGYRSRQYPRLRLLLHGPSPTDPDKKTAIYEIVPQRNFCAVSAGNNELTLSKPVAELLVSAAEDTPYSMPVEALNASVATAHATAANRAHQQPGTVVAVPLKQHPIYSKVFALAPVLPAWEADEYGLHASLVILGIFKPPFVPYGNPANRFHLYAVPPRETSRNAFFSRSYKSTYRNCLKMVDIYNGRNPHAHIKQVRIPLLRHGALSEPDMYLAKAATSAVLLYASRHPLSFTLDFPYDEEDTFFQQMQRALSPDLRRSPVDRGSVESLYSLRS